MRPLGCLLVLLLVGCGGQKPPVAQQPAPPSTTPAVAVAKEELTPLVMSQEELAKLPMYERLLKGEDERRAEELRRKVGECQEKDDYPLAIKLTEELLALRVLVQGQGHYETVNAKWDLDAVRKIGAAPAEQRVAWPAVRKGADEAAHLGAKGRHAQALILERKLLDYCRQALGEDHPYTSHEYGNVALILETQSKYTEAEALFRKALAILQKTIGEEHPSTATIYRELGDTLNSQGLHVEAEVLNRKALAICMKVLGPEHDDTAESNTRIAMCLVDQGKRGDAEPLLREALAIRRKVLGEEHPATATSCNNVGANLDGQGKYAEAEHFHRQALSIWQKVLGEDDPNTAISYNNLAVNLNSQGKYAEAEALHGQALAICLKALGDQHVQTARIYNTFAVSLHDQGKHAAAQTLHRKALDIFQKLLGNQHPLIATSCDNLANTLGHQGKYTEAEMLQRKALAIRRKVLGEEHPDTALSYNNIAENLRAQGNQVAAEAFHRKALTIRQKVLGEEHPLTASSYNNLANSLGKQGKQDAADRLYRQVLAIRQKTLGEGHDNTALSYASIGANLWSQGKFALAEPNLRRGLDIYRTTRGEEHPSTVLSYHDVASNLIEQGKDVEAEPFARAAVANFEAARLRTAAVGLERPSAQKISPRRLWTRTLLRTGHTDHAWEALEGHFGRGLLDDYSAKQARILTPDEQKEIDDLNAKLTMYEKQVSNLLSAKGGLEANREKFAVIGKERKMAETALAQLAARLQQKEIYDLNVIQSRLPGDAALLAYLDLAGHPKAARPSGEHWAFLLKATGEPVVVELKGSEPPHPQPLSPEGRGGNPGAWTDDDTELPGTLRRFLQTQPRRGAEVDTLCRQLYQQRLAPLKPHLQDIKHLIVLPSEIMAGIPLETLTDQFTVSYAPSGTMLAKLIEKSRDRKGAENRPLTHVRGSDTPNARRMLAVGDPTYQSLTPLPGTRREVEAIAALFPLADKVLGADASKAKLAAMEKDLGRYDVLHLATHGETNPYVALNSALVLSQSAEEDGKLTALHIRHHWHLNADLVVLSGCETGLGRRAGGEGYLGFTQALFLAGARSIILSQWQVSDVATSLLMVRFYENWLGKALSPPAPLPQGERGERGPMSKAEALKEAKHWLRNLTRDEAELALMQLNERTRGLTLEASTVELPSAGAKPFSHPFYWSAFILIGDPR